VLDFRKGDDAEMPVDEDEIKSQMIARLNKLHVHSFKHSFTSCQVMDQVQLILECGNLFLTGQPVAKNRGVNGIYWGRLTNIDTLLQFFASKFQSCGGGIKRHLFACH
jgi:hypothetical protein